MNKIYLISDADMYFPFAGGLRPPPPPPPLAIAVVVFGRPTEEVKTL
jgi:hypothetical protein